MTGHCCSIDFEDTYDGLGDQLDEADDALNDDTFGGGEDAANPRQQRVGRDFDFFGQTAKVSDAISEEQVRYNRQRQDQISKPAATSLRTLPSTSKTGYEKYSDPSYGSDLQIDPTLWGAAPRPTNKTQHGVSQLSQMSSQPPSALKPMQKRMMSLEEVEAAMQTKPKPQTATPGLPPLQESLPTKISEAPGLSHSRSSAHVEDRTSQHFSSQIPFPSTHLDNQPHPFQVSHQGPFSQPFHIPLRQTAPPPQPIPFLNRTLEARPALQESTFNMPQSPPHVPTSEMPPRPMVVTHPEQLMYLSEQERHAVLMEDAKRAKRNYKIFLLSKDNGLMTPQDKNFVTRIQLQQLMAATGNVHEQDPAAALAEDFYYQVYSQIRGAPRQHPHQPLNQFAQTYLFQTRQNGLGRRQLRGGDSHMQRMQQQVQRAVEAAKLKPKNKQLVLEGSLGKISFSNAKTPKPLLNIKHSDDASRPRTGGRHVSSRKPTQADLSVSERKTILRNIENVYTTLMQVEDLGRQEPPVPSEGADDAMSQQHREWQRRFNQLSDILWSKLKVMEPINPGSAILHPFMALISYPKGKKAIPRVFRSLSPEQRITMLTMIIVHLDILDVVRLGQLQPGENLLPTGVREAIDLFMHAVLPVFISFFDEAPFAIVIGMVGIILDRTTVSLVARTKVGVAILTMLLSRAEIVRQAVDTSDEDRENWFEYFNRLFDALEPMLGGIFPGTVHSGEDVYVWQFLATMAANANPDQQQRLVIAVKYVTTFLSRFLYHRKCFHTYANLESQGSRHGDCHAKQNSTARDGKPTTKRRQSIHESHWTRRRTAWIGEQSIVRSMNELPQKDDFECCWCVTWKRLELWS